MACTDCQDQAGNSSFQFNFSGATDPGCNSGDCNPSVDAACVPYSGSTLNNINPEESNAESIFIKINELLGSLGAIDWTGFDYNCLPDGISGPAEFVAAMTEAHCALKEAYDTFVSETNTTLGSIENPETTGCADNEITDADGIKIVLQKLSDATCQLYTLIDPETANWDSYATVTNPTTPVGAYNQIIAWLIDLKNIIDDLTALPIFDNTASCLPSPGETDTLVQTIEKLKTAVCAKPSFDFSTITWGCVTSPTNLQTAIANIATLINATHKARIAAVDSTYFTLTNVTPGVDCDGKKLNFVADVLLDEKVKTSSADTTPDYLFNKVEGSTNATWGLTLSIANNLANNRAKFSVSIDPIVFISYILTTINNNTTLTDLFCAIDCETGECNAPEELTAVRYIGGTYPAVAYTLEWTAPVGSTGQTVRYKEQAASTWISNINIVPVNMQTGTAEIAHVQSLNNNTVYQFQIASRCAGSTTLAYSNIAEAIFYKDPNIVTITPSSSRITIELETLPYVEIVTYKLYKDAVLLGTLTATGMASQVTFTELSSGSGYVIKYNFSTTVNGVTVNSNNEDQEGADYETGSITVPA